MIHLISITCNILTSVLIITLSLPLVRKSIRPNSWYGIRTKEAYASDENWYAINAYGGRLAIRTGYSIALLNALILLIPVTNKCCGIHLFLSFAALILPIFIFWILITWYSHSFRIEKNNDPS